MNRRIFAAAVSGAVVVMFACDKAGPSGPSSDVPGPSFDQNSPPPTPTGTLYAGSDPEDFVGTLPDKLAVIGQRLVVARAQRPSALRRDNGVW